LSRKTNYGAIAVIGVASFFIVDTAARNRSGYSSDLHTYRQPKDIITVGADTTVKDPVKKDTLKYPIKDRFGTHITDPVRNEIDLKDPKNISQSVDYDPVTKEYTVSEKIGDHYYRNPTILSFDDFYKLQTKKSEQDYWQKRASTLGSLNQKNAGPDLYKGGKLFDRIFGGNKVDIRPQGSLELTFGYQGQNIKNPVLTEQARKTGGFDFDMNINMNLTGKIGDKLKIITNYNTQSTFDFENQIKLEYTGYDDEIIKKIEAGNVSFPLRSTLISGVQSLFGIKTQLQFGRLTVTSVLSNQKSQKQNLLIKGGTQVQDFTIKADEYEDNRHFMLAQFFRDTFNYSMSNLPIIKSLAYVNRIEVWVTNKTGATTNTRDIVGLMDLAEAKPYNQTIGVTGGASLPANATNNLYTNVISDAASRYTGTVVSRLQQMGLQGVQEYEKTFARKLDSTEYTLNRQLGFISLNQQLQADEVLAVAYQYTYNGRVYQVGEFSQDVPPDQNNSANQKILFLKLLKATSARPNLPIWDLMMKNIYSTGAYQINRADFSLDIYYKDPGNDVRAPSDKRYLPDATGIWAGAPLISILGLDRLNNQNDPQPDGVFDYVEGYTINSQTGRVMFPVLEPFAQGIQKAFDGNTALERQYMFKVLYDSIKVVAQQFPQLNRYLLRGTYKSSNSSEIQLGGYNIPPGSVTVTAGGQLLRENVDYIIDYNLGRIKIVNSGVMASGQAINVQFENNAAFGTQVRNYFGTRFDYVVNDKLSLGSTIARMSERPYYQKVNYGEDPIKNTVVGFDVNYNTPSKALTRILNKLPNFNSTVPSNVMFTGEVARLFPGHSKLVNAAGSKQGQVFIDDFEGSQSGYDLKYPATSWALASTPSQAADSSGLTLFPEAEANNQYAYGANRAKLAWYIIEPTLQIPNSSGLPSGITAEDQSDPRTRLVYQQEVFPNRSTDFGQAQLSTLDLAYYPTERGPYNFTASSDSIDANGRLRNPKQKWAGIMRALDNSDFQTSNVQFIEFWIQDPFIKSPNSTGGQLYFNLGNVSEDVLKDSHKFFENGMPNPVTELEKVDSTTWGRQPKFQQQITQAFDNDPEIRKYQDVGYDGLQSDYEQSYHRGYLQRLAANFGTASQIYQQALKDAANDDYKHYRDYDSGRILLRYKRFSNPEGNSPVSTNTTYSMAATNIPETEDLNRDNTLNETEEYFQYRVNLRPNMEVGTNNIVDKIVADVTLANGTKSQETWYQFKVPIDGYDKKIGAIPDFKSIRFMRMFLTNFEDSVVVRFGKLQLIRNQWRQYNYKLQPGDPVANDDGTSFNLSAVNIEENSSRKPIPYVLPPGVVRQNTVSTNNTTLQLNEQAMSLQVCKLEDGDVRGVTKNLGMDLRQYKHLQMYLHAEASDDPNALRDGDLRAVIRMGSDFVENYYEYQVPLKVTPWGVTSNNDIWPEQNDMDLVLDKLTQMKLRRNMCDTCSPLRPYTELDDKGNYMAVMGNPNLGDVRTVLLGVMNPKNDGVPKCGEVWFNELRLSGLDEKGGYAGMGRLDLQLADLGTVTVSGNMHTAGFGNLDQRVNERFRDNYTQYDAAANLDLGKLLPKKSGLVIPVYAGYSRAVSRPEYDPYDLDIKLKDKLRMARSDYERDSIRRAAETFTSIKSLNFTNIRRVNPNRKKFHLWDVENFDLSYSFSQTLAHSPIIENDVLTKHRGGIGYTFTGQPKYVTPFKRLFKVKTKWLDLIRDFNFNYVPSLLSFRADITRQFGATRIRNVGGDGTFKLPETYNKYFTFDRYYGLKWDLTKSISIDFNAVNNARIDEPIGRLNSEAKKDTMWRNFFKLGRTTNYYHSANVTYTLPTNKLPLTSWTNVALGYSFDYRWTGASLLAKYLGNAIENTQQKTVMAEFKFSDLYNRSKWLRKFSTTPQRKPQTAQNKNAPPGKNQPGKQDNSSSDEEISPILKAVMKPLLMLKRINVDYSENSGTRLPGYIDSTKALGMNWAHFTPGVGFVMGQQPNKAWLDNFAKKGLITPDTTFNVQFQQQFTQRLQVQAQLEPYNDLRIDLSLTKSFTKTHTELFKNTADDGYQHYTPYDAGGFEISYVAVKTLFGKIDQESGTTTTFKDFERYRKTISNRLANQNPYNAIPGTPAQNSKDPEYRYGYSRYAQDVLIPAFLAAYTGKDPEKIGLLKNGGPANVRSNPFSNYIPRPNWRISYNGLNKLEPFKSLFTNFALSHAYVGSMSMSSYNSALLYEDPRLAGYPGFIDSVSGNYIPYFLVPNLTMTEQFAPLLGIDMTFISSLNLRVEFKKSRSLSLSLIDFQLTELRSTEVTLGGSYRLRNVKFKFLGEQTGKKVSNDMNFRLDLSIRDDKTVNNKLDADLVIPTSGQKVIGIAPSIDYVVNNRLNLRFFYDRRQTIPVISTAYPIVNTRGGLTLRFMLAQ
jgi:cell surface protein SprA